MIKYIIITFLFLNILKADEISDLIMKIKNAPISNKRVLINKLKTKLRSSNQIKRQEAISKLKHIQNAKHNNYNKMNMHKFSNHSSNMNNQIKIHLKEQNLKINNQNNKNGVHN